MTDKDIIICGHGSGNPTKKNLNTYSTLRYNQLAPNRKHKGIVAVRRLKGFNKQKKFVEYYNKILGRNIYSQPKRSYVYKKAPDGKYYSDCSSSGMATLIECGYSFPWLYNTASIYQGKEFETVNVKIKNGHIMNPEVLQVGDAILFVGSDPSRPKQIGHVEWVYSVPGTNCKVTGKGVIRAKADQTCKPLCDIFTGDMIRIIKDCKNGWSECYFGEIHGYVKNTRFQKVGKTGYPKAKAKEHLYIYTKNNKLSKKTNIVVAKGAEVKIVTKRKYWSYIIYGGDKGWVKTKYLNFDI